ncbi:Qat anti-phage system TatD family nuclease QatD [Methylosinus sp. RM1]|uniref:Qat anti-phage system TatD family nuclease QatD n=1 Tax=Methylosinus sp. RM1 TaxID=2583817 RepID=UPI0014096927
MIDIHCHLDLYPKPALVIAEAARRGAYILAVTTTPKAYEGNLRFVGDARRIRVAAGLHPELVKERYKEVDLLVETMKRTRYVGEIGLDGSPEHRDSLPVQKEVLSKILEGCRSQGDKIVSLHSRMAASSVLDAIESAGDIGKPVLHWFSGAETELARAIDLGCWFSIGPAMLTSRRGRRLASMMPNDRVCLETDGPFGKLGDQPLMPWDAVRALPAVAEIWGTTEDRAADQIAENFRSLLAR